MTGTRAIRFSATIRRNVGVHDAEPDVEPDGDHHEAKQERDAPAPNQELVAGDAAEHQHGYVCQQQAGGTAELRPGGDEAAVLVGPRPLHREQHRATPLAADANALDKTDDGQDDCTPDSDRFIGGDEADRGGRKPGQEQRGYQRRLAADAVAKVAEDRGADRPGDETHCVNGERLQHADQRIGLGKKQLAKDEAGHRAVEQEVVPFDGGAYGAGD